jgi:hypothetical protein
LSTAALEWDVPKSTPTQSITPPAVIETTTPSEELATRVHGLARGHL